MQSSFRKAAGRCLIVLGAISAGILHGSSVSITNPSFEDLAEPPGGFSLGAVPGWSHTINDAVSTFRPVPSEQPTVPDGVNVAAINFGNMFQTLSAVLTANTLYTLKVDVGSRLDFQEVTYQVSLEAGGDVLASDSALPIAPGTFLESTVSFFAAAGDPHLGDALTIRLSNPSNAGQAQYDFVRLDATSTESAVPEPASLWFFVVGGLGIAGARRRKRG